MKTELTKTVTLRTRPTQARLIGWALFVYLCTSPTLAAVPPSFVGSTVTVGPNRVNSWIGDGQWSWQLVVRTCVDGKTAAYLFRGQTATPPGEDYTWHRSRERVQRVIASVVLPLWPQATGGACQPYYTLVEAYQNGISGPGHWYMNGSVGQPSPDPIKCSVVTAPRIDLGSYNVLDLQQRRINMDMRVSCDSQTVITASFVSLTGGQDISFGGNVVGRLTLGANNSNSNTVIAGPGSGADLLSAITLSAQGGGTPGTYQAVGVLNVTVH